MRAMLFGLTFLLAGPSALADGSSPPESQAGLDASIEIGRFEVMLDQIAAAEKILASHADFASVPDTSRMGIHRLLVTSVLRFNVAADRICGAIPLPAADCSGPFLPAWLTAPSIEHDDPARLRAMIDEAGDRITNFWGDVCARVKSRDEHLCDIE